MNSIDLTSEIEVLLALYETEPEHTRHVALLAQQLFDALKSWHGLNQRDRDLLQTAALLHDIGWSQTQPDGIGHHKETGRMIRKHLWRNLNPDEVELVAQVARYHRKNLPNPIEHRPFALLSENDQRRIQFLSALLRVADGLDRRHAQVVSQVLADFTSGGLLIEAVALVDIAPEIMAADRKADLLRCLTPGVHVRPVAFVIVL